MTEQFFRTDEVANPMGCPREAPPPAGRRFSHRPPGDRGNALGQRLPHVTFFENGADAWAGFPGGLKRPDAWKTWGDLLICDVEMPQVDGFHLTRQMKQHPL